MAELKTDEGFFTARDGLRLYFQSRVPEGPAAHVVILHGYAEHLGRHQELQAALVAAGYATHAMDFRGHGQSGGKRAHVDRFDDYLVDLELFLARARDAAKGGKVFIAAHSHGSLVAARYLLDKPEAADGVILGSPYFRLKLQVPAAKLFAAKLIARVLPGLPMKNELKAEQLTRDVEIQKATRSDPLYQQIATPGWFTQSSEAQETVMRRATEFVTPFLLTFGGSDGIAEPQAGREFYEHATSRDKQFKLYEGFLHELYHEPERDRVLRDVVGWLDERARGAARKVS